MESQKAPSHQPTVADLFQRQKQWANSDEKSKQINKLIAEMIITDNQPFSVVSDVGFQRLVAALNPRYALKSEKFYRTEKIPAIHGCAKDKKPLSNQRMLGSHWRLPQTAGLEQQSP